MKKNAREYVDIQDDAYASVAGDALGISQTWIRLLLKKKIINRTISWDQRDFLRGLAMMLGDTELTRLMVREIRPEKRQELVDTADYNAINRYMYKQIKEARLESERVATAKQKGEKVPLKKVIKGGKIELQEEEERKAGLDKVVCKMISYFQTTTEPTPRKGEELEDDTAVKRWQASCTEEPLEDEKANGLIRGRKATNGLSDVGYMEFRREMKKYGQLQKKNEQLPLIPAPKTGNVKGVKTMAKERHRDIWEKASKDELRYYHFFCDIHKIRDKVAKDLKAFRARRDAKAAMLGEPVAEAAVAVERFSDADFEAFVEQERLRRLQEKVSNGAGLVSSLGFM